MEYLRNTNLIDNISEFQKEVRSKGYNFEKEGQKDINLKYVVWLRIADGCSVPEMSVWSMLF